MSSDLREEKRKICESMMRGEIPKGLYIICRNDRSGKPEFMPAKDLRQKYYENRTIRVVGITKEYASALAYLACEAYEMAEG